jgi:hypothetical protein
VIGSLSARGWVVRGAMAAAGVLLLALPSQAVLASEHPSGPGPGAQAAADASAMCENRPANPNYGYLTAGEPTAITVMPSGTEELYTSRWRGSGCSDIHSPVSWTPTRERIDEARLPVVPSRP